MDSARVGLAVAALIFIFPLMGIVRHGREGLLGVSWGHERPLWQICRQADQLCDLVKTPVPVNFGVYDPEGAYRDENKIAIEHLYVRWNAYDRPAFRAVLADAAERGRWPLVTVEPWPDAGRNRDRLFSDTVAGRYERPIANVCGDLAAFGRPVFVRWGHEMDYVTGRYPWAKEDAAGFVAAYRHFVETCRASGASLAFYVWSPVGTTQARRYWPGRAYADYVGLSVYGFPDWDLARQGLVRSFDEIFAEKYRGIADLDRPVMIAELGVTGTREHQARWMDEALRSAGRYPQLRSIVYFHAVDSREAWPAEFRVPDWRMDLSGVWLRFALRS